MALHLQGMPRAVELHNLVHNHLPVIQPWLEVMCPLHLHKSSFAVPCQTHPTESILILPILLTKNLVAWHHAQNYYQTDQIVSESV